MPLPLVLCGPAAAPFLGPAVAPFLGPAAAGAAKALALECIPAASSLSLAAILARMAVNRIPDWIKNDITFRRNSNTSNSNDTTGSGDKKASSRKEAADELECLSSVLDKLTALAESTYEHHEHNSPIPHLYASLLAYMQLVAQHKRITPEFRNARYHAAGLPYEVVPVHVVTSPPKEGSPLHSRSSISTTPTSSMCTTTTATTTTTTNEVEQLIQALHFATWAYYIDDESFMTEHLSPLGYSLLTTSPAADKPGYVGYFVAVSEEEQTLLIGVKGTSSLEEIATDTCGRSVPYHHSNNNYHHTDNTNTTNTNTNNISYSNNDNGIPSISTRVEVCLNLSSDDSVDEMGVIDMAAGQERIYVEMGGDQPDEKGQTNKNKHNKVKVVSCHEGILISAKRLAQDVSALVETWILQKKYKLIFAGHSLGASAACLAATILRAQIVELDHYHMHVFAFGPPPVLDYDSARAASSFITAVVNNSDVVTRSSLANVTVLLELLRATSDQLMAQHLAPNTPCAAAAFFRKMVHGDQDDTLLLSLEQLSHVMESAMDKVPLRHSNHLYIPGRVLLLHKDWGGLAMADSNAKGQRQANSNSEVRVDDANETETPSSQFCTVTDGAAPVLRFVEMDGYRMLGDHTTAAYEASLRALLPKEEDNENGAYEQAVKGHASSLCTI
jgi:surfactin synthase thioesterase subunit